VQTTAVRHRPGPFACTGPKSHVRAPGFPPERAKTGTPVTDTLASDFRQ